MAQIREIRLVDDLSGDAADETVEFGIGGKAYEIDLSSTNSAKLRQALAPFLSAARRMSGRNPAPVRGPVRQSTPTANRDQNQAIRDWAAKRGMKISDRGRIPVSVVEAFRSEHEAPVMQLRSVPPPVAVFQPPAEEKPASKPKAEAAVPTATAVGDENRKVIEWAKREGKRVPKSGIPSATLLSAYQKAQKQAVNA